MDNRYFEERAAQARDHVAELRKSLDLPPRYFLFVGRLLPRKGVDTLLEAYSAYRAAAAVPWGLVIVGQGPDEGRVRALASHVGGVLFAGTRYGDALCEHYACADTLVVPSECDPWALVINEGAACSLPLIVSRGCGAAATLVEEGTNGWTFAPGDARDLASLLTRTADLSDDRRRAMGERSRGIVAGWSTDRFAAGVIAALSVPRRPPAGPVADVLTRIWKGRVSVN